jgi:DNA-binding CsgD family transcriptional regulator/PAS domain-containing protein
LPRKKDLREPDIVDGIYEAALDPAAWPSALRSLSKTLHGSLAGIFFFDPVNGRLLQDYSSELPQRDAYLTDYAAMDPRNAFGTGKMAGVTFTDSAFIEKDETIRHPFYQEYLLPNDMGHVGAHVLRNDREGIAGVAVQRPWRQSVFGSRELELLERLAPHLNRALRLNERVRQVGPRAAGWSMDLLAKLPYGLVVFGASSKPLFVNDAAERILTEGDGLRLTAQGLNAAHPWLSHRLSQAIAEARSAGGSALSVRRPSGAPDWLLVLTRIRAETSPFATQGSTGVAIHILDRCDRPSMSLPRLGQLFDLSPAEARVAAALAAGRSPAQIAMAAGVRASTVKTQIEKVMLKTETGDRMALLRLLNALAQLP